MDPLGHPSIEEKIEEARALFKAWEEGFRRDSRICDLLGRLEQRIRASAEAMRATGVVEACKRCEEQEGGSCCGVGIENRYDRILLLINLLLGVALPDQHTYLDSCYFLQADGCCLAARHVLCVNYLCAKLKRALSQDDLIALQTLVGEELDTGFALYETVKMHGDLANGHR